MKVRFLSIDPAIRVYLKRETYRPRVGPGEVMGGFGVAEIVESRAKGFVAKELVFCDTGWTEYAAVPASTAVKLPKVDPLSHLVSVYGITAGFTAYIGMQRFGKPSRGETVVVSGAAGAVGLVAGQIAKIAGCTVIGIAGGEDKCRHLLNEYAFDRAIDYKSKDVDEAFSAAITDGIDLYFDNVGGETLARCAKRMNRYGRIVICGSIASYDGDAAPDPGVSPRTLINVFMARFLVLNFFDEYEAAVNVLKVWTQAGRIKVREEVIEGLENAPEALIGLLAGRNFGKRMVRVA